MTHLVALTPRRRSFAVALLACGLVALGCDDKSSSGAAADTAGAPTPAVTASATASATALPSAPAAAPAPLDTSGPSTVTGTDKDRMVIERDPVKEPEKSVKAATGGTLTLFLPDYPGTSWSVSDGDKPLGKVQEEVVPGFAPGGTMGHQFKWKTNGPGLKAGQKIKVQLVNKKSVDKGGKPSGTFALTIELS